jgi:hypothetical protein
MGTWHLENFTTEARRTQRRQGERKFYVPLPLEGQELQRRQFTILPSLLSFPASPILSRSPSRFHAPPASSLSHFLTFPLSHPPSVPLCLRGYFSFFVLRRRQLAYVSVLQQREIHSSAGVVRFRRNINDQARMVSMQIFTYSEKPIIDIP